MPILLIRLSYGALLRLSVHPLLLADPPNRDAHQDRLRGLHGARDSIKECQDSLCQLTFNDKHTGLLSDRSRYPDQQGDRYDTSGWSLLSGTPNFVSAIIITMS